MPEITSNSIYQLNVPKVTGLKAEFIYNFYERTERVSPSTLNTQDSRIPLDRIPRYINLTWSLLSPGVEKIKSQGFLEANASKIVSEEDNFNGNFYSHTFSDVSSIENSSKYLSTSGFVLAQSTNEAEAAGGQDLGAYGDELLKTTSIIESTRLFSKLKSVSQGLRFYDSSGNAVANSSDQDILREIASSVSLSVKMNGKILPDILRNSNLAATKQDANSLKDFYNSTINNTTIGAISNPVLVQNGSSLSNQDDYKILGFEIEKFEYLSDAGLKKLQTIYVEDGSATSFIDRDVLYGKTYFYSVKTIASVSYTVSNLEDDNITSNFSNIVSYVSSPPRTADVSCFEYKPPPPPADISFVYDHASSCMRICWTMPPNRQQDIKQFQVLRRKSVFHPYELIAHFDFDDTVKGSSDIDFETGEITDTSVYFKVNRPVYNFLDEDFYVDTETFTKTSYIYTMCAIDAHGIISNYSSQYEVSYDPYKSATLIDQISPPNSPRQYPNMYLDEDLFSDSIQISGDIATKMQVYLTPDAFSVYDEIPSPVNTNRKYTRKYSKIVELVSPGDPLPSSYVIQVINMDNQNLKQINIRVRDPEGKSPRL